MLWSRKQSQLVREYGNAATPSRNFLVLFTRSGLYVRDQPVARAHVQPDARTRVHTSHVLVHTRQATPTHDSVRPWCMGGISRGELVWNFGARAGLDWFGTFNWVHITWNRKDLGGDINQTRRNIQALMRADMLCATMEQTRNTKSRSSMPQQSLSVSGGWNYRDGSEGAIHQQSLIVSIHHWIHPPLNPSNIEFVQHWIHPPLNPSNIESIQHWLNPTLNPSNIVSIQHWIYPTLIHWIHPPLNPSNIVSIQHWIHPTLTQSNIESIQHWIHPTLNPSNVESIQHWIHPTLNPSYPCIHPTLNPSTNESTIEPIQHWIHPTLNPSNIESILSCIVSI